MKNNFLLKSKLIQYSGVWILLMLLVAEVPALELTSSEKAYIHGHKPVMCVDPDWWPFETIDSNGQHVGIAADLHELLREKLGLEVELFPDRTWEGQLRASKEGRCQMMSFLNQTPQRDQWLIFTKPLLDDPNVLITREEVPFIADLAALEGKSMALPWGTAMYERISNDYPNIRLVGTVSEDEAIGLVANKKVDMTLRSLIVAAYTIKRNGWFNLKINSQLAGYENHLRVGVLKSEMTLRDLLNKGIASITTQERNQIIDRHVEIKMVTDIDYTLVKWVVGVSLTILLTSLYWLRRLRRMNKSLQVALHEVQATEAEQRQFLSMLSHEIRSPLAVIDTTAQLLTLKLGNEHDANPVIARIRRGAARLASFFDNSLTQDRLNSKNFALQAVELDVADIASWAVDNADLLSGQHPMTLTVGKPLPKVRGDQTLLRILLNNLLSNAIKYCPAGTPIEVSVQAKDGRCVLKVSDRGPGIPVDDIPYIFQRFRRGKNVESIPGAGLGLALVARIVALHQGEISVECPLAGGTVFTVTLPLAQSEGSAHAE